MDSINSESQLLKEISELSLALHAPKILDLRLQVYQEQPLNFDNVICLVQILRHSQFNHALDILDKSLMHANQSIDPTNNLKLRLLRAEVFLGSGQNEKARNILNNAIIDHPNNQHPLLHLARLEASEDNFDSGLSLIGSAAELFGCENSSQNFFNEYAEILERKIKMDFYFIRSSPDGRPIYNVLLAYLVKDEGDVISQNLNHHYKIGFRNFVVMNNSSSDDTGCLIEHFKNEHPDAFVFILNDFITGYNQGVKTNAMAKYATSLLSIVGRGIDWVLPVDGDEFFVPGREHDMKSIFDEALQADIRNITFSWSNAATSDIESPIYPVDDIFSRFNLRLKKTNHYAFKVASRLKDGDEFVQGNHATTLAFKYLEKTMPASRHGSFILHLHMRNISHVRRKVINGGKAALAANIEIAGHWKQNYRNYLSRGDEAIRDIINSYTHHFTSHGHDINCL